MPVEIDELEQAARPLKERVLDFLRRDASKAFSLLEIFAGVEGFEISVVGLALLTSSADDRQRTLAPYQEALGELEREGYVRSGTLKGQVWFHAARK